MWLVTNPWLLWQQLWLFCKYRQVCIVSNHQHCLRLRFTWRKFISESSRIFLKRLSCCILISVLFLRAFTFYRPDVRNCNDFCTAERWFQEYASGCLGQLEREWSVLLPQSLLGFLKFSMYSWCWVWPFFGTDTLSLLFKDDCLFFWKWLLRSAKTSEVPLQSIKRLVYLLSAIDYYLILDFFPQGKRNNLCGVSGLFCGQREQKAVMWLTEEAVQLWIKVHLFYFSSWVNIPKRFILS